MNASCPACQGIDVKKNGHSRHGKQVYKCKFCHAQFSFPQSGRISGQLKLVVRSLLMDKVPVKMIARAVGCSESSIYSYKRGGTVPPPPAHTR